MRSLATSVILYEKVETTKPKAKEVQRVVEKLITCGKDGSLASLRKIDSYLLDKNASKKVILELSKLYKERNGGYTRVLNTGFRTGDAAPMARIELLDTEKLLKDQTTKKQNNVITEKVVKTEKSNSASSFAKASDDKKATLDKPKNKKTAVSKSKAAAVAKKKPAK